MIKNKKAQETITTDAIVTLLIVVVITMSFFYVNLLPHNKVENKIEADYEDLESRRELFTLLKTPLDTPFESDYGNSADNNFASLIVKYHHSEGDVKQEYKTKVQEFIKSYTQEKSLCFNLVISADNDYETEFIGDNSICTEYYLDYISINELIAHLRTLDSEKTIMVEMMKTRFKVWEG